MIGFQSSILAGTVLVRSAIQSPNYVTGVSGWAIFQDGTVEFNDGTFRGTLTANSIVNTSIGDSTFTDGTIVGGTMQSTQITFSDTDGGRLVVYQTTAVTQTFTTSGSWPCPVGTTSVKAECWGGGAGASSAPSGSLFGGGGGGGGEYAAELAVAVTPGNNYPYVVGAGGSGANPTPGRPGGNSTFTGNTKTVTANGAPEQVVAGGTTNGGGFGGTGSTNAIHFDGGRGGFGAYTGVAGNFGGGGGASSGGTGAAGVNGGNASGATGGPGATAPAGGGNGGSGRTYPLNPGFNGVAPGGGGGGTSSSSGNGGDGARGQVRLTYTTAAALVTSISPVAFVDAYGNNIPVGLYSSVAALGTAAVSGTLAVTGATTLASTLVVAGTVQTGNLVARASSTGTTGAVGAETIVHTLPSVTYLANKAYLVRITGVFQPAIASTAPAGRARFRVRKTNLAGQQLKDFGILLGITTDQYNVDVEGIFTVGGSNVTAALVATLQSGSAAGANDVTYLGTLATGGPRLVEVFFLGNAADYPDNAILV